MSITINSVGLSGVENFIVRVSTPLDQIEFKNNNFTKQYTFTSNVDCFFYF